MTTSSTEFASLPPAQQALLRAFNAHPADLAANREGRLSPRQRDTYGPPRYGGVVMVVILGHMALLGGLLGVVAIISGQPIMWLVLVAVLGLAALPFMLVGREGVGRPVLQDDVKRGVVVRACGPALLSMVDGERPRYTLLIDGQSFEVSRTVFSAFQHNRPYCLYYLPNSRHPLSAEPAI